MISLELYQEIFESEYDPVEHEHEIYKSLTHDYSEDELNEKYEEFLASERGV